MKESEISEATDTCEKFSRLGARVAPDKRVLSSPG